MSTDPADRQPATEVGQLPGDVPREPDVPDLSAHLIADYTDTVFLSAATLGRSPSTADVLFVFGAPDGLWHEAANLFHAGRASTMLVTGHGFSSVLDNAAVPEAHLIRDDLVRHGVPSDRILVEDRSLNTLENVLLGKKVLEEAGLPCSSIRFFCHAHHAGRAWRTLARWFPGSRLSCATHDATYGETKVRAIDWWKRETSRKRVHGEYARIRLYARQGDIEHDGPTDIS